jgi:hypothetical protein
MLLVFLIATTYSTMSPLVLPFALIYFALCWMSTKYLLCFVCMPSAPAEGEIFPALFTRLCWCLITFQVVLLGVLGGRNLVSSVAIIPLIVMQVLFWLWTDRQFHDGAKYGALDADAAGVLSKEDEHMKNKVESKMAAPLMEEEDSVLDVDISSLLPGPDTYKFTSLRPPLFQLESQDPELATPEVDPVFWRTEWVAAETGAPVELPQEHVHHGSLRFRLGHHRSVDDFHL